MDYVLPIIFENNDFLAVNKPAGLHSAPLSAEDPQPTALSLLLKSHPELVTVHGFKPWEPALLHRLDQGTSGILLLAKRTEVFDKIRQQFSSNSTNKTYLALTQPLDNALLPPEYRSYFMRVGKNGSKVKAVQKCVSQSHGRKCSSDSYRTQFIARQSCHGICQVTVVIHRGFRHQIRCHMATVDFPIVGDELYNGQVPPIWANRMYLHAQALDFTDPVSGQRLHLQTPMPWSFPEIVQSHV